MRYTIFPFNVLASITIRILLLSHALEIGILQVVGERWGSLGQLTVSLASNKAAPSRAHLHAIQSRKKGLSEEQQPGSNNDMDKKVYGNN
jgi:hypothetical protein